jgi:hypothetical protein
MKPEGGKMTEAEWLVYTNPKPMLEFLLGKASERKMHLFACACCRRIWHLLVDVRSRRVIEAAEQFIEGEVSREVLATAITSAIEAREDLFAPSETYGVEWRAAHAATKAGSCALITTKEFNRDAWIYAAEETSWQVRYAHETEGGEHASLLRDLFGPLPFRPETIKSDWPAWQGGTIPQLAQAIYEERRFHDLPVLADALEEAGCDNADILAHCRQPGEHVRGCWVVDLLLGKE